MYTCEDRSLSVQQRIALRCFENGHWPEILGQYKLTEDGGAVATYVHRKNGSQIRIDLERDLKSNPSVDGFKAWSFADKLHRAWREAHPSPREDSSGYLEGCFHTEIGDWW